MYKVELIYFRPTGRYLASAEILIDRKAIVQIWEEVTELRRWGRLPGLRQGAGRDLLVFVDVPDHPDRVFHLVIPPFIDEDDVTPPRGALETEEPIVHIPLAEMPRTSTRDIVRPDPEADTVVQNSNSEEITPVDRPIPVAIDEE